MERRTHVRIPYAGRGKAEILTPAESGIIYTTTISRQGLGFYSIASLALGSEAHFELEPEPPQGAAVTERLQGRVLWKREWDTINAYGVHLSTPLNRLKNPRLLEWIAASEGMRGSGTPQKAAAPDARTSLTKREFEIIRLIGQGAGNREIAERLSISIKTVETHRANIYSKLKVHNAVQLLLAIEGSGS